MDTPFDSYKDIVENSADGILVLDPEGIILYCNPAAKQFFRSSGQPPEGQLFGFPVVTKEFTELEMVSAKGDVVSFEMRVAQTTWKEQQAFIASLRDITRRKKSENDLKEVRMQWEMTFNAIEDVITILDLSKRIVLANESVTSLVDKTPAEMAGRPCSDLFGGIEAQCSQCPFDTTLADNKRHTVEITLPHTQKIYRVTTFPKTDQTGQLTGVVHITKDITEQKALGRQLRQAQK
ncbi:MAG: PAS domain-containing protein, partial [Desulfobacterales bacterium]|nr:PAS domain-containing protein [Desulfobacterales bacterium]